MNLSPSLSVSKEHGQGVPSCLPGYFYFFSFTFVQCYLFFSFEYHRRILIAANFQSKHVKVG